MKFNFSIDEKKYEMIPLQEEASTRKYFLAKKIDSNSENSKTQGKYNSQESSINDKDIDKDFDLETFVVCRDKKINEDFVHIGEHLLSQGFPVPKIYGVNEATSTIYQEYLGTKDLYSLPLNEFYESLENALESIFTLQKINPHPIIKNRFFDFEKLIAEVNITLNAIKIIEQTNQMEFYLPPDLIYFFQEICTFLGNQEPKVLTHRDFHSRNIMVTNENQLVFIDFQDARMGLPVYDLASILYDAYKPITLENREKYLEEFISKLGGDEFKTKYTYYLQALQRSFKALGTYLIQVNEKGNNKFLPSLYNCLDNIEEIIQLGCMPDSLYLFVTDFRKKITNLEKFSY